MNHNELRSAIQRLMSLPLDETERLWTEEENNRVALAAVDLLEWWTGERFHGEPITLEAVASLFAGE